METTAGSVTSTKQFVWSQDRMRPNQPCEERDATGTLTKKFFAGGQMNSSTKYFYDKDHLGSVREMTDNTGVVQAQYVFDPYGQVTKISETNASDFGYAGYYLHSRSGLNLTRTRAYSSSLARFISRDPIQERGGNNLFVYLNNNPENLTDPSGTDGTTPVYTGVKGLGGLVNTVLATTLFQTAKNLYDALKTLDGYGELDLCQAGALNCFNDCFRKKDEDLKKKRCYKSTKQEFQDCMEKCIKDYLTCTGKATGQDPQLDQLTKRILDDEINDPKK